MPDAESSHDDQQLLREYREGRSAAAFTELVRRHVDAVFSSALRRVHGDRALAEDVTQQVFTDFARKAGQLPPGTVAGGWLHRHTGFTASHFIDRERRRRAREQEAAAMNALTDSSAEAAWHRTAPLLDAAMDSLPPGDRDALVLRFFEHRDFRGVGQALGISDDTAQKRVSRALEKLRALLTRRGVTGSGAALSAILLAHTVSPAPAALAAALPGRALAGAAAAGGSVSAAFAGLGAAARWKLAGIAACLTAAGALPFVIADFTRHGPGPSQPAALTSVTPPVKSVKPPTPAAPVPATAVSPRPLPEIITAAAAELRGGAQNISATTRALALLGQIAPAQAPEALSLVEGVPDESARALLYRYILSQWAEADPWAAINYASGELPEQYRLATTEGVLSAWAARDPEAVIGWNSKTAGTAPLPVRESLLANIFKTLASRDLTKAFRYLQNVRTVNERAQALRGVMETVQTQADRERVLEIASELGDAELRTQTKRAVVENWTHHDAAAAAAWVEQSEPAWERSRLMDTLGLTWLQSDPAAAAAWWIAREPGRDTMVKIINVWSQKDPNAAGAWLDALPPGPQSDAARTTFARQIADLDAASALTWAATVSDAAMREPAISHIYESWRARDPAAAAAFLKQSGWPEDRLARLLNP